MNVRLDPDLLKDLKKLSVRVRNSFKEKLLIFEKNPHEPSLNNHKLHEPHNGYRSIDITNNYRALYKEAFIGKEEVAYFSLIGTHKELYG